MVGEPNTTAPKTELGRTVDNLGEKVKGWGKKAKDKAEALLGDADKATGGELGKNKFGIMGALLFGVLGFMMGGSPIWGLLAAVLGGGALSAMQDGPDSFVGGLKEKISPSQTKSQFLEEIAKGKLAGKIVGDLDRNKDGSIDHSECAGVQEPQKNEELIKRIQSDTKLQEAIAGVVDKNKDSKISASELGKVDIDQFAAVFTPTVPQPTTPSQGK